MKEEIRKIATVLTNCANKRCDGCPFIGMDKCKDLIVEQLGEKAREIQMGLYKLPTR